MSTGRFPKNYVNDVPKEGADKMMEYVNFDRLGIGARSSGLPKENLNGAGSLEHVGKSAGGKS